MIKRKIVFILHQEVLKTELLDKGMKDNDKLDGEGKDDDGFVN